MAARNPTYITRSKHGIYYFQLFVTKLVAEKLGIKSRAVKKSLKTRDKRLALIIAHRIHSQFYYRLMSSRDKDTMIENPLKEFLEMDEYSKALMKNYEERQIVRLAKLAQMKFSEREKIEGGNIYLDEVDDDVLTKEEWAALEYVSENNIDISLPSDNQVVPTISPWAHLKSERLSVLRDKFCRDKALEYQAKRKENEPVTSAKERVNRISLLIEIIGDVESNKLDHEHLDLYKDVIIKLPSRRKTRPDTKKLTIAQLTSFDFEEDRLFAPLTIKEYSGAIRTFLGWCADREYVKGNICVPIKTFFTTAKSKPFVPFDNSDLERLFLSNEYLNGQHKHPSHYWAPLLALFSGARENEICQLRVNDIVRNDTGIVYLDIKRGDTQSTKNEDSVRKTPVHSAILKLGFMEYVQVVKNKKYDALFPDLDYRYGKYNHGFSKWFNARYRVRCKVGIDDECDGRKTFHSFRKNFANALESEGGSVRQIGKALGHADRSITEKHYLSGISVDKKAKLLNKVKFDIDLSKIRSWKFNEKDWLKTIN